MKLFTILIINIFICLGIYAHNFNYNGFLFSEEIFKDGKYYLELTNKKNLKIASIKIITKCTTNTQFDTIILKQNIIDSLNKSNSLIVIVDSTLSKIQAEDIYSLRYLLTNDTIKEELLSGYYKLEGESVVYIDSSELHKDQYMTPLSCECVRFKSYHGRSKASLGKPNKREDAFAIVKGKFTYRGEPFRNAQFTIYEAWRLEDGDNSLTTDSEGNFTFACWSSGYNVERYRAGCVLNTNFCDGVWFSKDTLQLGVNNYDMYFSFSNLDSLKAATKFQISPSLASTQLQVSYCLPKELLYQESSLQISNTQGQTLQRIALEVTEGTITLNLAANISNGTYLCSLVCDGVVYKTVQFMVQR